MVYSEEKHLFFVCLFLNQGKREGAIGVRRSKAWLCAGLGDFKVEGGEFQGEIPASSELRKIKDWMRL